MNEMNVMKKDMNHLPRRNHSGKRKDLSKEDIVFMILHAVRSMCTQEILFSINWWLLMLVSCACTVHASLRGTITVLRLYPSVGLVNCSVKLFFCIRRTPHSPRTPLKWDETFPFLRGLCTRPDGRFWRVWSKKLWSVLAWLWASIPKLDKVHQTSSFECKFVDCQWREMERTTLNADDVASKQAGPWQSCFYLTRRFAVVAILEEFWRFHRFWATWWNCPYHLLDVKRGDFCPAYWFIRLTPLLVKFQPLPAEKKYDGKKNW